MTRPYCAGRGASSWRLWVVCCFRNAIHHAGRPGTHTQVPPAFMRNLFHVIDPRTKHQHAHGSSLRALVCVNAAQQLQPAKKEQRRTRCWQRPHHRWRLADSACFDHWTRGSVNEIIQRGKHQRWIGECVRKSAQLCNEKQGVGGNAAEIDDRRPQDWRGRLTAAAGAGCVAQ